MNSKTNMRIYKYFGITQIVIVVIFIFLIIIIIISISISSKTTGEFFRLIFPTPI